MRQRQNNFVVNAGVPILSQFDSSHGTPLIVNTSTDAMYYSKDNAVHHMSGNFAADLVLSKASGTGIKVDNVTPTFPWFDLIGDIHIDFSGANDPVWTLYNGTLYQFCFPNSGGANTKEVFNEYHIPHDYVPGSDLHIHVHLSTNQSGQSGDVKWYFDMAYAPGHNTGAFTSSPKTISVVQTVSGTQYKHMIAEVQITNTGGDSTHFDNGTIVPDGLLMVRSYRNRADAADTTSADIFLHFIDIHYQSTGIGTKNKSPNFYS